MSTHYVYIRSEPGLWTVGFYDPAGKWQPESDHGNVMLAAARVAHLNGSHAIPEKFDAYSDSPKQVLALMGLQSERYSKDADFRKAVDDVLRECGLKLGGFHADG